MTTPSKSDSGKTALKTKTTSPEAGGNSVLPKVLVAEDNPVVRKGLGNFIGKWGYEPVLAESGDAAWQILEKDKSIRLAILDWNLPGLTGMQVCQRLRKRNNSPYVYTLIFSARTSTEEQVMALDGGADDYLAKPAKPSLLKARLGVGHRILETLAATGEHSLKSDSKPGESKGLDHGDHIIPE